jgi:hypothetical protein
MCNFEHRAAAAAAEISRSVEIPGGVEDQTDVIWVVPVHAVGTEAMQDLLRPTPARSGSQLEGRPVAVCSAKGGGTVQITGGVEDQAAVRVCPVRAIEDMEQIGGPVPARFRRQLEHCPFAVSAAGIRNTVEIAGGVEDQAALRDGPSVPLKLCSALCVQRPPASGVSSNTVPLSALEHSLFTVPVVP